MRYGDGTIVAMTTINNIADLVRILKEQPEWADTIRGILLSEELLELPARFAEFVQLTQESHRTINERLTQIDTRVDRLETGQTETNRRLESLETAQAIRNGFISHEQSEDLYDADIIISDEGNRHVVVEVSLTADQDDIVRAKRRAAILSAATGGAVTPVVITTNLNDAQRDQAAAEEVITFIMAYP